jgi:hypothetical protein
MILDSLLAKGNLTKMTISALAADPKPDSPPQPTNEQYVVLVNPNTYRINYALKYNNDKPTQGKDSSQGQFAYSEPISIDFEILFDGTGVIPKQPSKNPLEGVPGAGAIVGAVQGLISPDKNGYDVAKEIIKFNKIVYDYDGQQHKPKAVQIVWGKLVFYGKLRALSYQFKLFKSDGTPLRALANVTFENHRNDFLREAIQKTSSPDLSHIRTVQEGDTLPLMCYRIYGDSSLYLEIARVNNLQNFRKLEAGMQLQFPPLEKTKK